MKKPFDITKAQAGHPLTTNSGLSAKYLGLVELAGPEFNILIRLGWEGWEHKPEGECEVYLINKAGKPQDPEWSEVFIDAPDEAKPKPVDVQDLPFLCMVRDRYSSDPTPAQVTAFSSSSQSLLIPSMSSLGHIVYRWTKIAECINSRLEWCDARQPQRKAVWRKFETTELPRSEPDPSVPGSKWKAGSW